MKRSLKSEAFVLKKRNLLNKDKIVTLFSKETGKIKVFAHGIRKITSRRLPHLETGNLIKIEIYKKNKNMYLQETALISGFYKIKNNSDKHKFLYLFLFLLDKLLPEEQTEKEIYDLTKSFFKNLSEKEFQDDDLSQFLNKLIQSLGYIEKPLPLGRLLHTIEQIINEKISNMI